MKSRNLMSEPTQRNSLPPQTVTLYRSASLNDIYREGQTQAEEEKPMTGQVSGVRIKTLTEAIQTVIHDVRIPKKLRLSLAAYQDQVAHPRKGENDIPLADQPQPKRLRKTTPPLSLGGVCKICASRTTENGNRCIPDCRHALNQRQLVISLWHNSESPDWSIEINGHRHEHVTGDIMEALVECALIVAQSQLTKPYNRRPQ
jgi:hypothetical protein